MTEYRYTVLFTPAEEGGYTVTCPALPGLVTEGDDYEQAVERVKEAIECHIESLIKDGEPVPKDTELPLEPRKATIIGAVSELVA